MGDIHHHIDGKCSQRGGGASADRGAREVAAEIAAQQWDLVTRAQLAGAGVGRGAWEGWLRSGALRRTPFRGVYAFGHAALRPQQRWLAAVLACGEGVALGTRSAAHAWALTKAEPLVPEVLVPRGRRGVEGVATHRLRPLAAGEVVNRGPLPLTSVERTLVDLAATARPGELERLIGQAEVLRLLSWRRLLSTLGDHRGRKGVAELRALATRLDPSPRSQSELERRFRALVKRAGLPQSDQQKRVGPYRVDFLWRAQRVVIETDGRAFHETRAAIAADRRRDRDLQLAGWIVLRFGWDDVTAQETETAAALRKALVRTETRSRSAAGRV